VVYRKEEKLSWRRIPKKIKKNYSIEGLRRAIKRYQTRGRFSARRAEVDHANLAKGPREE
jgi:hypothetical protein